MKIGHLPPDKKMASFGSRFEEQFEEAAVAETELFRGFFDAAANRSCMFKLCINWDVAESPC